MCVCVRALARAMFVRISVRDVHNSGMLDIVTYVYSHNGKQYYYV